MKLWNRVLWVFWVCWALLAFPKLRGRAVVYYGGRMRRLTPDQIAEVWQLAGEFTVNEQVGFMDSIGPGADAAANAITMLRRVKDPSYFTETVVDTRYAGVGDVTPDMRAKSWLIHGTMEAPTLGYQDVIALSDADVPAYYAKRVRSVVPLAETIACHSTGVPAEYAVRAASAGKWPSQMWAAGVPAEYLV